MMKDQTCNQSSAAKLYIVLREILTYVEDVDQGDDPFNNRGISLVALVTQHSESDSEPDFDNDES
jgi:hypothetical protein